MQSRRQWDRRQSRFADNHWIGSSGASSRNSRTACDTCWYDNEIVIPKGEVEKSAMPSPTENPGPSNLDIHIVQPVSWIYPIAGPGTGSTVHPAPKQKRVVWVSC